MASHKLGIQGSEAQRVSVPFQPHPGTWKKRVNIGEPPSLVMWIKANMDPHLYGHAVGQTLFPKAGPSTQTVVSLQTWNLGIC